MKSLIAYFLLGLLFLYSNLTPLPRSIRNLSKGALIPITGSVYSAYSYSVSVFNLFGRINSALETNKKLQEENRKLRSIAVVNSIDDLNSKYKDSNSKLGFKDLKYLDVIGHQTLDDTFYLMLRGGSNKGIKRGMSVMVNGYLVGAVYEVGSTYSIVETIQKASIEIPVENTQGTIGTYKCALNSCMLQNVITSDPLNANDMIFTTGTDGNFKKGLIIGQVYDVQKTDEAPFKSALLYNQISLNRVSRVSVIYE